MSLNKSLSKANENFFLRITVANCFGTCGLALSVTHRVQVLPLPVQVSFQSLTSCLRDSVSAYVGKSNSLYEISAKLILFWRHLKL